MSRLLHGAFVVFTLSSATLATAFDSIKIENGGFDKLPADAGEAWSLEGEADLVSGLSNRAKVEASHALSLQPGAELRVSVVLPPAPEKEGLPLDAWYAIVSVDVHGGIHPGGGWSPSSSTVKELRGELTLTLLDLDGERAELEAKQKVVTRRPEVEVDDLSELPEELDLGDGEAGTRLWLRVPATQLAARVAGGLQLEFSVAGKTAVTIDNLRVERFHEAPTRALLGKENGKNGPDLLGAGMLGFTGLTEHQSTSFSILDVREGGPAQRAGLVQGDLVVAVDEQPLPTSRINPGWDWFHRSNEAILGRAIQSALEEGRRSVTLGVLRERGVKQLELKLPLKGDVDDGFPLNGKLGDKLCTDLLAWTVSHQKKNGGWPGTNAVNPAMGGLALLGTRDKQHAPAIRRCFEFLLERNPSPSEMTGLAYWTIAFQGIFFAEYYLASGDERAREWMIEASEWLPGTTHECKWGMQSFGHGPDGLPYGEKSLMAPTAHLLVYDALARKCDVESRIWEHVREYVVHSWSDPESEGHGGMGYNASYKDKGEFWSRSGLTALAAALRGENGAMRQGLCVFMQERHPWMLNSHAYGEPGAALGLLSLAVAHRPAYDEIMPQWRWRFLNSWEPGYGLRYSTPHMGAPYMGKESIVNLSYALLCAVENRGLVIAGGEPKRWLK